MGLDDELVGAVGRHEILAYYQPQIDLASGTIVAVEALSRWQHPSRGLLQPNLFIGIAEQSALILEIGDEMIDNGCRCSRLWGLEVAVNVSAAQLATTEFFDHLMERLIEESLGDNSITVEITESKAIGDLEEVSRRLSLLRELGVDISIDDFGSGFSSLDQVLSLPVTEVKLDRSLIQGHLRESEEMMTSVIAIAHARGIRIVAEGIETAAHLELARNLGCDRAQGYLLGMPTPENEVGELLRAHA
jgi:EAL domain-containing protein (putative c-di-GMP-specific phosphodiesterase class I)